VVAIPADDVRTTPLASAQRTRKRLAVFLRVGLLSFAAVLFAMLPSGHLNEGRDRADDSHHQCGPLQFDFRNPCNAILAAAL
jgi:hypothetical protein